MSRPGKVKNKEYGLHIRQRKIRKCHSTPT